MNAIAIPWNPKVKKNVMEHEIKNKINTMGIMKTNKIPRIKCGLYFILF